MNKEMISRATPVKEEREALNTKNGRFDQTLTFRKAPGNYELCFNEQCSLHEQCMHYQMWLMRPRHLKGGPAVYPSAWEDGECVSFRDKKLVRMAYGFNGLYKNMDSHEAAGARKAVMQLFSMGKSTYYRFHTGERLLSPKMQEEVLRLVAQYGNTDGVEFDHYVDYYDFT